MILLNTARGWSKVMISERASLMIGLIQKKYGLLIIVNPALGSYRTPSSNYSGNHHEDCPHHRLLIRLWTGNCTLLSRARLECDCHHANTSRKSVVRFVTIA